ncbi:helix-turn-helix domain containing protein [Psychromarinibacter sp. C21-152]|uniref:Helix-turn-helix domain containing protein n=1 Tax=Psychromarinibacter sediminicola TaxID=3033385 RepID=A0AAE3TBH3_9RHOB|nr:TetR/AcrR family transcriptional regulator [Psychromarinibacter sediminicola]MDF0603863.1 helix-turn-helix domain containing protein [Psychromarinibacter sediminicola]
MPARLRLSAEERRSAILDAAARLLASRGWEALTVSEILGEAGLSKGGFYHHFSSKEDILEALVRRFADAATAAATTGAETDGASVVERISRYLWDAMSWELDHTEEVIGIVRLVRRPGNRSVFTKLSQESGRRSLPGLRELLSEGVAQGVLDLADIDVTADLFLQVARTRWLAFIDIHDAAQEGRRAAAEERLARRLRAEQQAFDRLLGLREGSIRLPANKAFEKLLS